MLGGTNHGFGGYSIYDIMDSESESGTPRTQVDEYFSSPTLRPNNEGLNESPNLIDYIKNKYMDTRGQGAVSAGLELDDDEAEQILEKLKYTCKCDDENIKDKIDNFKNTDEIYGLIYKGEDM